MTISVFINCFKNRKKDILLLLAFLMISGILTLSLGQDKSIELQLYHYFNVHSFLTHRMSQDIVPCGIQSYFNPILDIPYYLLSKYLNNYPRIFVFLQGFWGGILMFLIYKITDFIFKKPGIEKTFFILFSIIVGTSGWVYILELGTCLDDLQVSIFSLLTLYILLKTIFKPASKKRTSLIFLAGLSLGIGVGLKLTICIFATAFLLTLLFLYKKISSPIKTIFYFLLGCSIGFLIIDGHWLYTVYSQFKNPVFPFLNNFFKSEYTMTSNYIDSRFRPQTLFEWLFFYPLLCPCSNKSIADLQPFIDHRYILSFISVIIFWLIYFVSKFNANKINKQLDIYIEGDHSCFIFLFITFSYMIWLKVFSILRYILTIEILTGIILSIFILYLLVLFKKKFIYICILILLAIFLLRTTTYQQMKKPIGPKLFEVQDLHIPDGSVVFLCGFPVSFYAAFQNPNSHFVYSYSDRGYGYYHSDVIKKKIKKLVCNHKNNIYALIAYDHDATIIKGKINNYAKIDERNCILVKNNFDKKISFCKLSSYYK